MNEISFHIGPIRPPSEADSLLFQVTNGCTWNKCRFCQLYKHTNFKAYSVDALKHEIDNMVLLAERTKQYRSPTGKWDIQGLNEELAFIKNDMERQSFYMIANWLVNGGENVFLQDGNSLVLQHGRLSEVLKYLKQSFPNIKRITSYGRAENLSRVSAEEFAELKEAGLDRIHSGFETGSDRVLQYINKGVTQKQEIIAGKNIKNGGIELSIYFMPGVGGKPLSKENAEETAYVLNQVNPDFLRIRTFAAQKGTELYQDWETGKHIPCSDEEIVLEIRRVIELAEGVNTVIVSDHIINLLQKVEGKMVDEKQRLLDMIDEFLDLPEKQKREYQIARRMRMVMEPADMNRLSSRQMALIHSVKSSFEEMDWDKGVNSLMQQYI